MKHEPWMDLILQAWLISRILSVYGFAILSQSFLWALRYRRPQATYPERRWANAAPVERVLPPYLVLLRMGFAKPTCHQIAGELLPHRFTLTSFAPRCCQACRSWRFILCCTIRRVAPPGR